ncbi:hypothetical protein BAUCODRAFT_26700 [Baudoinia panamericana UAMH 10762]|uniref:DUF7896 domain-containing protein n=1 Tax=Baudoinia panamericana (strain UAMH 10762) TaxID=717646 RepID=M2LH08_BAUPA|nr:uncharacterized protein BAUCODRAFT_26700 [Baudoinia panamericana UAMH 10762]EMC93407.1 hypothetical protein BAUCODRAFT_26700 [Baudoinia panamericana UAMH 10762]
MYSSDVLLQQLEQEKRAIWSAHPSEQSRQRAWLERKAQLLSYLARDSSSSAPPTQVCSPGSSPVAPTATSYPSNNRQSANKQKTNELAPSTSHSNAATNMARSTTASFTTTTPLNDAPSVQPSHPRAPSMSTSAGLPCRAAPSKRSTQHVEALVYDPATFVSRLESSHQVALPIAAKRQRVGGSNVSQELLLGASHLAVSNAHLPPLPPFDTAAIAMVSPSTSMSSQPSLQSLTSSEAMSRQSSVTSTSVADAFDMMRVESSSTTRSQQSDFVPFPLYNEEDFFGLDASFVSEAPTEKPCSSLVQTLPGFDDGMYECSSGVQMVSSMGAGFVGQHPSVFESFPSASCGRSDYAQKADEPTEQAHDMKCSLSDQSDSATSPLFADPMTAKAVERRRKHIENGRQSIAPKTIPQGPRSTSTLGSSVPLQTTRLYEYQRRKAAISRTPYVRRQPPKLRCTLCSEHPGGFRGEHELRRHYDRAHAETKRVWICVEPAAGASATKEGWWPTRPLAICKQCKHHKTYNVYYNAAAHLRRSHFCPRKRGRKARGEERESRAGKAGGDWPPIEWLKANGWLQEIELPTAQAQVMVPNEHDMAAAAATLDTQDLEEEEDDEVEELHNADLAAGTLGLKIFPACPPSTLDFSFGLPTPIDTNHHEDGIQDHYLHAPAMAHAVSAPPALRTAFDSSILYDDRGFQF